MRWRRLALIWVACLGAEAACSSFTAHENELPGDDGGTPDSATPTDESSTVTPSDSGAPALAFCEAHADASFCLSFENTGENDPRTGSPATTLLVPEGGPEPWLTDAASSPPNALAVEVRSPAGPPPIVEGKKSGIVIPAAIAGTKHIRCDFALWADQLQPDANPSKANVDVILATRNGNALFDYSLLLPDAGAIVGDLVVQAGFGVVNGHNPVGSLPRATWTPAAFDIALDEAGNVTVQGKVGTGFLSQPATNPLSPAPASLAEFRLQFGETYVTGDWTVHLDDIVCTWE